jgi:hypothetical protein
MNITNKSRICMHACEHDKYRICRCPRIFAAIFCMNWKKTGNFVKLFCFDNGFCSFWFQLDCFCYRMNSKRIIEFGLRRISELFRPRSPFHLIFFRRSRACRSIDGRSVQPKQDRKVTYGRLGSY